LWQSGRERARERILPCSILKTASLELGMALMKNRLVTTLVLLTTLSLASGCASRRNKAPALYGIQPGQPGLINGFPAETAPRHADTLREQPFDRDRPGGPDDINRDRMIDQSANPSNLDRPNGPDDRECPGCR
jgi:hypothetical protein